MRVDKSRHTTLVVIIGLAATLFVGLGDLITGADITFTMLYAIPIGWCTWRAGFRIGLFIAIAALGCLIANVMIDGDTRHWTVLVWNEVGVLALFVTFVYLIDRQREYVARERREKQRIVEQLRHADRLNVIGTLAAGVAHEIGTPLNVISGSAELLPGARPEDVTEMSQVIRDQTGRISAIIRHLLDFGRRGGTQVGPVDLDVLLASSTRLLLPIARKRSTRIVVEPSAEHVVVRGNASELEQVISNLVLNAIQAMPHSGTVTLRTGVASRSNGRERYFGTIVVDDTGVGIAPNDLPRIFDPFFTTKGVGEGTGLGLSVSYGIVHDHGGTIEVDSIVGKGTRFTVLLPLDEHDADHGSVQSAHGVPD